jgi:hypothetical protein
MFNSSTIVALAGNVPTLGEGGVLTTNADAENEC